MAEYQAFDPNVVVLGVAVKSFLKGIGDEAIPSLKEFNIYPLEEDNWYNQQSVLNAYKKINEKNYMNLVAIGMKAPDQAAWPPEITTVHAALSSLQVAYSMNHRGGEIGEYFYKETGDTSGIMVCTNPYPSDFDYGMIYRMVQKFRPLSSDNLLVQVDDTKQSRKKGGDSCTYLISW